MVIMNELMKINMIIMMMIIIIIIRMMMMMIMMIMMMMGPAGLQYPGWPEPVVP